MSHHVLSRIPPNIRDIFRFYECLSKVFRDEQNSEVIDHLRCTHLATFIEHFWRMNVTAEHSKLYNAADFPPLIGQLVAPMFQNRNSEAILGLLNEDQLGGSLISSRNHSFKHFTDFQARILLSFASSLSPYKQVPLVRSSVNSFKWYQRLLRNSPIIFFLKQKKRLMSESSLLSHNPAYEELRMGIADLAAKYSNSEEYFRRTKNYYLTDLASSDLFRLALSSRQNDVRTSGMHSTSFDQDKLCDEITRVQKPKVIDSNGQEIDHIVLEAFCRNNPFTVLRGKLEKMNGINHVHTFFPFDIAYNDVYLLTIEPPVIEDDHDDLLRFIHCQAEFDVFAVRIASSFPMSLPFETFLGNSSSVTKNINATYEDLLVWAEKQRQKGKAKQTGSSRLIQTIGEWGLVEVSESADSLCLTKS